MTERQETTKRYNVVAINLVFSEQSLFLKGSWDGHEKNIPSLDVKPREQVNNGLMVPPLIIDGIDHRDEIEIRDYAHECRFLYYMSAKVRQNLTIRNTGIYSEKLTKLIDDKSMNEATNELKIYFAIKEDMYKRIHDINRRTIQKKPPPIEEIQKEPSIPLKDVVKIYDQFCSHVSESTKELKSLEPMKITLQTFQDITDKILDNVPVVMKQAKKKLENLIKATDESTDPKLRTKTVTTIDTEERVQEEEEDTKPAAIEGKT